MTSAVYLCTRLFRLLRSHASSYRAICAHPTAIRARSTFIRQNCLPVDAGTAAPPTEDAQVVFDDDCMAPGASVGHSGCPNVLILFTVRSLDNAELKFATCSCNEEGAQLVDDLVTYALSHSFSG